MRELHLSGVELELLGSELHLRVAELELFCVELHLRAAELELVVRELHLSGVELELLGSELHLRVVELEFHHYHHLNFTDPFCNRVSIIAKSKIHRDFDSILS